jgi:hypothetical protein
MDEAYNWLVERLQSSEVVAVVIAAVIAGLARILRRGRLVWSISHQHMFVVPIQPPPPQGQPSVQPVYTRDIWVQNTGRSPVTDVEVVLVFPPQHFEIWPQRAFQVSRNPDGRCVITVASLGPQEFFIIVMLSPVAELPLLANMRSSDGMAHSVNMGPQQIYPRAVLVLLRVLLFLGVAAAAYLVLHLIQWLSASWLTP